ncbi:hypothetical protein PMAC_001185 [Pneumocystis sp. 'macacae']|nr:hypothetical protein PMAC_001185 [Pneumocystis sp. 'macacae']
MPNVSTLTSEDKQTIKKYVPKPTNKIITAAVARLYVAHPNPNQWRFTGISGAVVFVYDVVGNTLFLKIVDISDSNRGIIWDQELYEDFQYHQDRTFFHSFELEKCIAGLSFADVSEASVFYRRVNERLYASHKNASALGGSGTMCSSKASIKKRTIDKSKIGAPSDFQHVSHIGWDSEKGFTAENLDSSWKRLFDELGQFGFSYKQIEENKELIRSYVSENGGLGNINQASNESAKLYSNHTSQESTKKYRLPPPPIPVPTLSSPPLSSSGISGSLKRAPPPPPPRKSYVTASETTRPLDSVRMQTNHLSLRNSTVNRLESLRGSLTDSNVSVEPGSTDIKTSSRLAVNKSTLHENATCKPQLSFVSESQSSTHTINSISEQSTLSSLTLDPPLPLLNEKRNSFFANTKAPVLPEKPAQLQPFNKMATLEASLGSSFVSPPPPPPPLPPPPPSLFPGFQSSESASPESCKKDTVSSFSRLSGDKPVVSIDTSNMSAPLPEVLHSNEHSNLMASIRSSGGISMLRKVEPALTSKTSLNSSNGAARVTSGSGGFINLEDALVAVLNHRKEKVTLSDDDESDDDEWDD